METLVDKLLLKFVPNIYFPEHLHFVAINFAHDFVDTKNWDFDRWKLTTVEEHLNA